MVPLPEPEAVTVHQVWSELADQEVLLVTVNEVVPAMEATLCEGGVTASAGAAAA